MYKKFFAAFIGLLSALIMASSLWLGAFAAPETIANGQWFKVELDAGAMEYQFTAPTNTTYDVCLFPATEAAMDVQVELFQGNTLLATGQNSMLPISQRLIAGETYAIRLSGSGSVYMEIARHALSRCFAMPMRLDATGDEYAKAIARSGDVHWYSVVPDSDLPILLAADATDDSMMLAASVFGPDGRMVVESVATESGGFFLDFTPQPGQQYCIRLWEKTGATGSYTLMVGTANAPILPTSIALSQENIVLGGRSTSKITAEIVPDSACDILFWESSDESIVRVSQNGRITGVSEGNATVTAYGPGGLSARCTVTVEYVPVSSVGLLSNTLRMHVGDDASLECEVLPYNATDSYFEFSVYPENVVEIDGPGIIRAIGEGTALITVTTRDGHLTDTAQVMVEPSVKRYRALLIGQQSYAATVAAQRPGSANSVSAIRSMLENLSFDSGVFRIATHLDASSDEVLAAIEKAFATATDQDLSLFYITCHGYYADGTTYLQMADGSMLTVHELEQALRAIPGEIIVLIDCCGSGGAIAQGSSPEDLLAGIITVFQGSTGSSAFALSKYKVIASAALEQDSYRISLDNSAGESGMATVFARALCEGLGWSIDTGSRSALRADVNYDGNITFTELCNYTRRRVMWYLDQVSASDYVQTVKFWPEASTLPLFSR